MSVFFHRQFFSCLKAFLNVLQWKHLLNDNLLKELSIDCLLNRYLIIGLQTMPANMSTISIIEYVSFKSIFGVLRLRHPDLHFMLRLK